MPSIVSIFVSLASISVFNADKPYVAFFSKDSTSSTYAFMVAMSAPANGVESDIISDCAARLLMSASRCAILLSQDLHCLYCLNNLYVLLIVLINQEYLISLHCLCCLNNLLVMQLILTLNHQHMLLW